ncbi:MAG: OmpH family outer membrane protein [Sedimenticolaceae bacterium]|jgi:outer membrane protein
MLSIKSILRYYLFLLVLLGASALHAAPAVGFVDVVKVTRDAPQMKEVEKALEEEFVLREQKIIEMRDQIAALQEKLDKEKRSMSTDERRRLERDIKSRELRYNYNKDEFLQDKQLRTNEERNRVFRVIDEVIAQVGKSKSLEIILSAKAGVLWRSERIDITDDVMQQLQSIAKPIAQPQK